MNYLNKIIYLICIFILANCTSSKILDEYNPVRFEHNQYKFDVANIIVETEKNHIDPFDKNSHLLQDAVKIWASDRLISVGESKILKIVIKNAKIKNTNNEKFAGNLNINFEIYDEDLLFPIMESNFEVSHMINIPENASLYERQSAAYDVIRKLITNFNEDIDKNMANYFGKYLI